MKTALYKLGAAATVALLLFASVAPVLAAGTPTLTATGGNTPYSTLSLSGTGFQAGEKIQFYFGLSTASTTADTQGTFSSVPIIVPNVSSGTYAILAIGQGSGSTAFDYFYVSSFFPNASPSTWWTAPGTSVTFSGSNFAPNEQITIAQGSSTPFATFNTDSSGNFTGQGGFTIPYSLANSSAVFNVHGASSNFSQTLSVGVGQLYPYASPSAWYILPGNTITFSGGGFGANETVNIYSSTSTTPAVTTSANAQGTFATTTAVMVPFGTGVANFSAVGASSGATVNVPVTRANFYPSLSPSAYYSAPSGTISLSGSGFAPNENVLVSMGASSTPVSAQADSLGNFSLGSLQLPAVGGTNLALTAVGQTSGATANASITMGNYYTWIVVNNWYAEGGTPLVVTGHNFAPNESVALSTPAGGTFDTTNADQSGNFTANTTVPYAPAGSLAITATGAQSNTPASLTMTAAVVYTDLELGSYAGAPGSTVEFIGHGYVPNDVVEITTDRTGATPVATIHADATGSFDDKSFSIPSGWAEGNLTFTINGTKSFDTKTIVYYVTGN